MARLFAIKLVKSCILLLNIIVIILREMASVPAAGNARQFAGISVVWFRSSRFLTSHLFEHIAIEAGRVEKRGPDGVGDDVGGKSRGRWWRIICRYVVGVLSNN